MTAHPDDESMFFLPFIKSSISSSTLDLLCLSIGDADGLGKIRVKELEKASSFLEDMYEGFCLNEWYKHFLYFLKEH